MLIIGHILTFENDLELDLKLELELEAKAKESFQFKQLVDYQLEVDKGKLTAVANLKS